MPVPSWYRRALIAASLAALTLNGAVAVTLWRHGGVARDYGWTPSRGAAPRFVIDVDPGGVAAGRLAVGDRVVAVQGDRRVGSVFGLHFFPVRPGSRYTLTVERDGHERSVTLPVGLRRESGEAWRQALGFPAALVCTLVAQVVGWKARHTREGRMFAAAGLTLGTARLTAAIPSVDLLPPLEYLAAVLPTVLDPLYLAVAFHFLSAFPASAPADPPTRWARAALYAGAGALVVANVTQRTLYLASPEAVIAFADGHPRLWTLRAQAMAAFTPMATLAILVLALGRMAAAPDADRSSARLVLAGLLIAIVPSLSWKAVAVGAPALARALAGTPLPHLPALLLALGTLLVGCAVLARASHPAGVRAP